MNALVHTFVRTEPAIRLPSGTAQFLQTLGFSLALASGFAAAATLAFLQTGLGVAESSRIIAALAAALGWVYLGLAIDEERISDAMPDIISFALVTTFALLSLGGSVGFIAAAFAVHLGRAILRLSQSSRDPASRYGLMTWIGFTFGSALVSIAAIG